MLILLSALALCDRGSAASWQADTVRAPGRLQMEGKFVKCEDRHRDEM